VVPGLCGDCRMGSLYGGAKYVTWFAPKAFTQSLGKARGALPFDSHLVPLPGNFCSRLSFLALSLTDKVN